MSKFVKDLITNDLKQRLDGVEDALLVDVIGLENNKNVALRQRLRKKNIHLLVVKNSLARRATEGTRLGARRSKAPQGTMAVIWGGEDIISLAKEVIQIAEDKEFEPVRAQGRRHGRPAAVGRPGEGGQQVAEPPGAAQHFERPDFERRRERCRANCSVPAASWRARSRRRAKKKRRATGRRVVTITNNTSGANSATPLIHNKQRPRDPVRER